MKNAKLRGGAKQKRYLLLGWMWGEEKKNGNRYLHCRTPTMCELRIRDENWAGGSSVPHHVRRRLHKREAEAEMSQGRDQETPRPFIQAVLGNGSEGLITRLGSSRDDRKQRVRRGRVSLWLGMREEFNNRFRVDARVIHLSHLNSGTQVDR